MHPRFAQLESLSEAFMNASGFFGGVIGRGTPGTLGKTLRDNMTEEENTEFGWEIPRRNVHWAEFFSKIAARQGLSAEAAALVPVDKTDANTVSDLNDVRAPQFAQVVGAALQMKR